MRRRLLVLGAVCAALAAVTFAIWQSPSASAVVGIMALIALATLASEDLACIGAGLMVARGTLPFVAAVSGAGFGIVVGDLLLFAGGRWLGRPLIRSRPLRWLVSESDLTQATDWFNRRGARTIFISRFVPGMRLPTYVAAGVLQTPFWTFAVYFLIAAGLWTPLIVGAAALMGEQVESAFALFDSAGTMVLLGIGIWMVLRIGLRMTSRRGRLLMKSRWRRIRYWEFWPPWIFYPPLLLAIGWLAVRYRSLTVFTAANPSIELGGFVGESKANILTGLDGAGDVVAPWTLLPEGALPNDALAAVRTFQSAHSLTFPVVVKPDVGERGRDVLIARDEAALAVYFEKPRGRTLVQAYVSGREFGLFYARHPDTAHGRLISVTDKRMPSVTGDGRTTLEMLILSDERAVAMAPLYLRRFASRLLEIPLAGTVILLAELGTHCRGAAFHDGQSIATPALEAAIDRISCTYPGFYFGRYDVRTADLEAFRKGTGFKIIELNGVTSEATHIYQPGTSLLSAYRTLYLQWMTAFEIGSANVARGAVPARVGDLVRALAPRVGLKP